MKLLVVRHAVSEDDALGVFEKDSQANLTRDGRRQAKELASQLGQQLPEAKLWTASNPASLETADALGNPTTNRELGVPPSARLEAAALGELGKGLSQQTPEFQTALDRTIAAVLTKLADQGPAHLIVTDAAWIMGLVSYTLGGEGAYFCDLDAPAPGSVTVLTKQTERPLRLEQYGALVGGGRVFHNQDDVMLLCKSTAEELAEVSSGSVLEATPQAIQEAVCTMFGFSADKLEAPQDGTMTHVGWRDDETKVLYEYGAQGSGSPIARVMRYWP